MKPSAVGPDYSPIDHWINGENSPPSSGEYFVTRNPLDDTVLTKAAAGTVDDVHRAIGIANEAFTSFKSTLPKERERILCEAAALLERDRDEFVSILVDEIGSPIRKAGFEVEKGLAFLRASAGMTRQMTGKTIPSDAPGKFSMSVRSPLGVVAAITPFNVPLIKGVRLSCNPIALGNTVVMLPSEESPLLTHRLAQLYSEAGLPEGVFNVVSGSGYDIGDALTTHSLVKMVTFTGSCRIGQHIGGLCGKHGKRMTLELGGKSPLVVMADAKLDAAIPGAVQSIFMYQGQVCMGASRVYVHEDIFEPFLAGFKKAASNLSMGDLRDPSTMIGPIISHRQRERVRSHIEDAIDKGATVVTGGEWDGNRCQPTILTDVTPEMTVYAEETFGPVVSVYPIRTLDEAIERSNDSRFGLSAAIYTQNIEDAMRYVDEVESGMVHVNGSSLHDEPHVPFGGTKDSGVGREGTEEDIEAMTELKWVTIQL
ncbi:MAG: aldehyde dehydrogenase family protein [Pseudomonadota bacterium]